MSRSTNASSGCDFNMAVHLDLCARLPGYLDEFKRQFVERVRASDPNGPRIPAGQIAAASLRSLGVDCAMIGDLPMVLPRPPMNAVLGTFWGMP